MVIIFGGVFALFLSLFIFFFLILWKDITYPREIFDREAHNQLLYDILHLHV